MTATQSGTRRTPGRRSCADLAVLVNGARGGDALSWERLVVQFSGMIWAIARAHRLSDADAADVAQTTWLALLDHLGDLREPEHVGAWLATSARRECLKVLRLAQRCVPLGDELPEPPAVEADLDERLLRSERDGALRRCFSRLRASDQALLRLLGAEPAPSYEEISAGLGMPLGSIGPTRARALQRLRTALCEDGSLGLPAA